VPAASKDVLEVRLLGNRPATGADGSSVRLLPVPRILPDVRSCRSVAYPLRVHYGGRNIAAGGALTELATWFNAMDHTNYVSWIAVHLRDMVTLPTAHPEIAREYEAAIS